MRGIPFGARDDAGISRHAHVASGRNHVLLSENPKYGSERLSSSDLDDSNVVGLMVLSMHQVANPRP